MTRAMGLGAWLMIACSGLAQPACEERSNENWPPEFASPDVPPKRNVALRVHTPKAEVVRLASSDLPGMGMAAEPKKGDNGVWEATVGPVSASAYRDSFPVHPGEACARVEKGWTC